MSHLMFFGSLTSDRCLTFDGMTNIQQHVLVFKDVFMIDLYLIAVRSFRCLPLANQMNDHLIPDGI